MNEKFKLMLEFQNGLKIDKHDLDEELIRQPEIFYRVSNLLARATSDRDSLKLDMEQAEAKLYLTLRAKAESKEEKFSEKSLGYQVESSSEFEKIKRQHQAAVAHAAELLAMKEAYQQRSYVLKDLVGLYTANYFTTESGGKARASAMDDAAERTRREAGKLRREKRAT